MFKLTLKEEFWTILKLIHLLCILFAVLSVKNVRLLMWKEALKLLIVLDM